VEAQTKRTLRVPMLGDTMLSGRGSAPSTCKRNFPEYLVPAELVIVTNLPPITQWQRLIARHEDAGPATARVERGLAGVASPVEEQLAQIWSECAHAKHSQISDNFSI